MWEKFTVGKYQVEAKVFDEPDDRGLQGAQRVTKLSISVGGVQVYNFSRGLDFCDVSDRVLGDIVAVLQAKFPD